MGDPLFEQRCRGYHYYRRKDQNGFTNSTAGWKRHTDHRRPLCKRSRPTVAVTKKYRSHIDEQMSRFIAKLSDRDEGREIEAIVRLGLEHEMQHQELLVYDIKHLLCDQFDAPIRPAPKSIEMVTGMAEVEGGLFELGYRAGDPGSMRALRETPALRPFAFDNEKPQHKVFLEDFLIDRALVSNAEYLEFMNGGGYEDFRWWHSAGWEKV